MTSATFVLHTIIIGLMLTCRPIIRLSICLFIYLDGNNIIGENILIDNVSIMNNKFHETSDFHADNRSARHVMTMFT